MEGRRGGSTCNALGRALLAQELPWFPVSSKPAAPPLEIVALNYFLIARSWADVQVGKLPPKSIFEQCS